MYNDVVYLITQTKDGTKDEYGDPVVTVERKQCFAKIQSISQSEFYQASTAGLKPELKIILPDFLEYNDEKKVVFNNLVYDVLRTYVDFDKNTIEITLHGGVRDANA